MDKEEVKEELPKKKKVSQKEFDELKASFDEITKESSLKDDKILRLSAEMQNMKKRFEEEKSRLIKYDGEEVIEKILPILDNFEHAIKMDDNDLTDEVSKFLSGFKMIYGNMVDVLKTFEVSEIDCLHKPFDEEKMNAVLVEESPDFDNNLVLDVLQKGYVYKDKVLRPAMVKVNHQEEAKNE